MKLWLRDCLYPAWEEADHIRKKINENGWDVKDTLDGPIIVSQ